MWILIISYVGFGTGRCPKSHGRWFCHRCYSYSLESQQTHEGDHTCTFLLWGITVLTLLLGAPEPSPVHVAQPSSWAQAPQLHWLFYWSRLKGNCTHHTEPQQNGEFCHFLLPTTWGIICLDIISDILFPIIMITKTTPAPCLGLSWPEVSCLLHSPGAIWFCFCSASCWPIM